MTVFGLDSSYVNCSAIGQSIGGRPITAVTIGQGTRRVLMTSCHHANEWLTGLCLWGILQEYCRCLSRGSFPASCAFVETTLCAVPWVNPDGAALLLDLATAAEGEKMRQIAEGHDDIPYPEGWKANARGVDLNLNYPAKWEQAVKNKGKLGFTGPSPRDWPGTAPISEPETKALGAFTEAFQPDIVVALHSQGEEIYANFGQMLPAGTKKTAQRISDALGYPVIRTPGEADAAGYKDWFIQTFDRPGFTVELGCGENPLPLAQYPYLLEKCIRLMWTVCIADE